MKYTKSALGLLNAQYKSVLKKCLLINLGLFALTAPAIAADQTIDPAATVATNLTAFHTAITSNQSIEIGGTTIDNFGDWVKEHPGTARNYLSTIVTGSTDSATPGAPSYAAIATAVGDFADFTGGKISESLGFDLSVDPADDTNPGSLVSALTGTYAGAATTVVGAVNALDTQIKANADAITTLNGNAETAGSVANSIATAVQGLDASASQVAAAANGGLNLSITEVDGKITAISGSIAANTYDAHGTASGLINALDAEVKQDASTTQPLALTVKQVNGAITEVSGSVAVDGTTINVSDEGKLAVGTIGNANIADNAAIAQSKISGLETAFSNISVSTTDGVVTIHDDTTGTADVYNKAKADELLSAKQDKLVAANAGNGIAITPASGSDPAKIAVQLATNSGLKFDNGLAINTGNTMTVNNEGYLNIKYGSQFTNDENGLKLNSGAVDTAEIAAEAVTSAKIATGAVTAEKIGSEAVTSAKIAAGAVTSAKIDTGAVTSEKIDDGAVSFAKLGTSGVYTTTVGEGSDSLLATTSAVKSYADTAVEDGIKAAIVNNATDKTVTLTGSGSAQTVYDTTGTANYVKANAEGADYTGKLANGETSTGTIKAALNDTNVQVKANTDAITLLNNDVNTAGSVLNSIKGNAENATYTVVEGAVDLTANSTLSGALHTLDTSKASLAKDNTFTGANTFAELTKFKAGIEISENGANKTTLTSTEKGLEIDKKIIGKAGADITGDVEVSGTVQATGGYTIKDASDKDLFKVDSTALQLGTSDGAKFKVTASSGNVETNGTVKINGATLTGSDSTLSSDKQVVSENGFKVSDTTKLENNKLTLKSKELTDVDTGENAITEGAATTIASTATVLKSAENAVFTVSGATGSNITGEGKTINTAIDALDTAIGNRTIESANTAVNTALATDVATAVKKIGDEIGTQIYANNADVKYDPIADNTDLTTAVSQVASNIGAAISEPASRTTGKVLGTATVNANIKAIDTYLGGDVTATARTTGKLVAANTVKANFEALDAAIGTDAHLTTAVKYADRSENNGVKVANSVNANIAALNSTIGNITDLKAGTGSEGNALTNGTGEAAQTVVQALNNIDATLGQIHGLKAGNSNLQENSNLAEGTTVEQHLVSLDDSIGNRNYASTNYISAGDSVADAVSSLDQNLGRVEHKVDDLRHDFKAGMASMAAMTALVPNPRSSGDTSLSIGTGAYDGHTAMAIGGFHYITDNIMLNAGAAWGNNNDVAYRLGVTWSW